MANVHEVGNRYYWHTQSSTTFAKLLEHVNTNEIEPPFRQGRSLAIRLPFVTKTLVIGRWTAKLSETQALLAAVGGRVIQSNSVSLAEIDEL